MLGVETTPAFLLYQALNFVLAMAMYTLIGRFLLSLAFDPEDPRVIWRVFRQVTDPILAVVRLVTPRIVADRIVVLFAIVWLLLLRVGLYLLFASQNLLPSIAALGTGGPA